MSNQHGALHSFSVEFNWMVNCHQEQNKTHCDKKSSIASFFKVLKFLSSQTLLVDNVATIERFPPCTFVLQHQDTKWL